MARKQYINLYTGEPVSRQAANNVVRAKEVSYSGERLRTPKTLVKGTRDGFLYTIQDNGQYPMAFVALPEWHTLYGLNFRDELLQSLDVRGRITYAGETIPRAHLTNTSKKWWIGWQYDTSEDFVAGVNKKGTKWTADMIIKDVHNAIKTIAKMR